MLLKCALHPSDQRTFDTGMRIAPMIRRLSVAAPLVSESDPSSEADLSVDDQVAAMAATIGAIETIGEGRMIVAELASFALHVIDILVVELSTGADPIQDDANSHAGLRALAKGVPELSAHCVGIEDVSFEIDALLRRLN